MPALPSEKFLESVERTISANLMFQPGDSVLVGVSGGPDSVALFYTLFAFTHKYSFRFGIAHLNHHLRGSEADRDARFVSMLAQRFDVPFYLDDVDVRKYARTRKLSVEEAGRWVRRKFLNKVAKAEGFHKIALGHHADDNAELILMYLMRGSGPLGISGMPPVRDGIIVRPFIERARSEILEFLHGKKIEYITDASNRDERYLRNRIRHHLIPVLKDVYNPNIIETLNRLSRIVRSEDEWMEAAVQPLFDRSVMKMEKQRIRLSLERFAENHMAVKRRILRRAVEKIKGDLRQITFSHIEAARHLAETGPTHGRLDLPDRIRVERKDNNLLISKEKMPLRESVKGGSQRERIGFEYLIRKPETIPIQETGDVLGLSKVATKNLSAFKDAGQMVAFFDMDTIQFPLVLRNVRPGDRFSPLGLGGTQTVKDFFIKQKIPREARARCPILLSRERIIWVVGHRIDESVKVTGLTRNLLKAELFLA